MRINKAGAAIFIAIIAGILIAENVFAHALLVRSLPAANSDLSQPPAQIEFWFSEPVEEDFSSVRLLTTAGEQLPVGATRLDPTDPNHLTVALNPVPPGIYTVAWVSLSRTDGHEFSGSFPFTVLNPDGSRPPGSGEALTPGATNIGLPTFAQTVSRWLVLMGGILFVSVPLFLLFVTQGYGASDGLGNHFNTWGIRIVVVGVLSIIVGSWMQIVIQAAQLGSLMLFPRLLYGTNAGALALARQALTLGGLLVLIKRVAPSIEYKDRQWIFVAGVILEVYNLLLVLLTAIEGEWILAAVVVILLGCAWGWAWFMDGKPGSPEHHSWILNLALGSVTLFLFSIGSHASAVPGRVWAVLSDFIHLLATSAWLGGLMLLPIMLEQMRRFSALDRSVLGPFFRRYGYLAKSSFFLLITTGIFNSLVQFPTWVSLVTTFYGQVLLVKLLLVFLVWWVSIRGNNILRRASDPSAMSPNIQRFNRYVARAVWIGLFGMAAVAALVQTQPPPRVTNTSSPADTAFSRHIVADDLSIHVQVTPTQVGNNQFRAFLSHEDGSPIGEVQLVRLLFDYQDQQIGQARVDLQPQETNVFGSEGAYLNQPGTWKLSLYVRRRGMDDSIADIGMLTLATAQPQAMLFQNPVTTVPAAGVWAGILIALGAEVFRWRKTLQQWQPARFRYYLYLGGGFIVLGLLIGAYLIVYHR